jgi:hypothetical protein
LGVTYKQGTTDETNKDAKIALETKFKSIIGGNTYEGTIKQDGSYQFDVKTNCLAVLLISDNWFYFRDLLMLKDSPLLYLL